MNLVEPIRFRLHDQTIVDQAALQEGPRSRITTRERLVSHSVEPDDFGKWKLEPQTTFLDYQQNREHCEREEPTPARAYSDDRLCPTLRRSTL